MSRALRQTAAEPPVPLRRPKKCVRQIGAMQLDPVVPTHAPRRPSQPVDRQSLDGGMISVAAPRSMPGRRADRDVDGAAPLSGHVR